MYIAMTVSTIRGSNKNSLSNILLYIIAIAGVGLVVYFGGEVIRNIDNLKGKSAVTVDVLNGEAQVFVNDEAAGGTPFNSKDIVPGENKVTLRSDTRQYETTLNFIPNDKNYIHNVGIFRDLGTSDLFSSGQEFWFERDKSGSVLRIVSEPSGATAFIDNTEVGKTPYSSDKFSDGEYDLRLEYPDHEAQTARINIKKDYTLNINLKLFPIPVTPKVSAFEGSPNLFDLSIDNTQAHSDTQNWVNTVIYWNRTRGINLEGLGSNKELVFDYFLDFKGNIFNAEGKLITTPEEFEKVVEAQRGAYLGQAADSSGLTAEAREAFESLMGMGLGGKKATIIETGTGWLRVRDAAGLSGSELTRVNVGNTYSVLEETTGWVKIKVSEEIQGWVSADYVTLSEE